MHKILLIFYSQVNYFQLWFFLKVINWPQSLTNEKYVKIEYENEHKYSRDGSEVQRKKGKPNIFKYIYIYMRIRKQLNMKTTLNQL